MEDGFKDPHSGLLYNKFNASHEDELDKLEGELLPFRMVQTLAGQLPPPHFDAGGLQAIHHHIFQDIYAWAGELRGWGRYQAVKDSPATGHLQWMYFGSYVQLTEHLNTLDQQLAAENYLRGLALSPFIARFAYYFDQYNYAHSFREGNGRTLAVAFWLLGEQAGFDINLVAPTGALRYNHARDYAILRPNGDPEQDLKPLRDFFSLIIKPLPSQIETEKPVPTVPASPFLQRIEAMREVQQMQHWVINSLWIDNPTLARELRSGTRDIVHPTEQPVQLKKLVETADTLLNKQQKPVNEPTEKALQRILKAAPKLLNGSAD